MADQFPSATVTGTDLSPIQPEWVPPNCHFEIDDVSLEWTFPPNHFDFIHIRELFGCIPDWDFFFQQAYRHTKPGGWVEIVEHSVQPVSDDGSMGPEHFYHEWGRVVIEMGQKFGKSFTIWEESAERMRRAGFVDVVEVQYKWPMNGWPKDEKMKNIGRWNQLRLMDGVEGFMLRLLTQVGGVSACVDSVMILANGMLVVCSTSTVASSTDAKGTQEFEDTCLPSGYHCVWSEADHGLTLRFSINVLVQIFVHPTSSTRSHMIPKFTLLSTSKMYSRVAECTMIYCLLRRGTEGHVARVCRSRNITPRYQAESANRSRSRFSLRQPSFVRRICVSLPNSVNIRYA
jgi:hypothetical protein